MIQAVTAYGNPVPKAPFQTRSEAIEWAKENAHIWPGLKVVVRYPNATRTIWRDRPTPTPADIEAALATQALEMQP